MDYLVIQQTASEIIVARFKRERREVFFVGASRAPLSETDLPLDSYLAGRDDLPSEENRVILSLKPELIFFREIELALTDRRKLREILPVELKGETLIDADELAFDAMPLQEGKVLALWTRKEIVSERVETLSSIRLEPEIVTSSHFHWKYLLPEETSPEDVTAISDGDAIAVFRGKNPLFFRNLTSKDAGKSINATLTALEIGQSLKVNRFYTHGALARNEVCLDIESAPLPVTGAYAGAFGDDHTAARDLAGSYAVVMASAFGESVNFRSGTFAYSRKMERVCKKLMLPAILVALLFSLVITESGLRYYLLKRDIASLDNSARSIYRELFPNRKKPVDEVGELRSEIKRMGMGTVSGNILQVLKKLAETKPDDLTGLFEVEIDGDKVRLKGEAKTAEAVQNFRTKANVYFSDSEVGEIKSRPDGGVSFTFSGMFRRDNK